MLRYTWEGETMRYRCDTLGWSWIIPQARQDVERQDKPCQNKTGNGESKLVHSGTDIQPSLFEDATFTPAYNAKPFQFSS